MGRARGGGACPRTFCVRFFAGEKPSTFISSSSSFAVGGMHLSDKRNHGV